MLLSHYAPPAPHPLALSCAPGFPIVNEYEDPIVDLAVIHPDAGDEPPPGFEPVLLTWAGTSADFNAGTMGRNRVAVNICVQRASDASARYDEARREYLEYFEASSRGGGPIRPYIGALRQLI